MPIRFAAVLGTSIFADRKHEYFPPRLSGGAAALGNTGMRWRPLRNS
jgi:hypothetical protein